jgi:CheY-like chemotaxis protein
LPLLGIAASAMRGMARQCEDAGFNGFLPKPINRLKLFKMLEHLLSPAAAPETSHEHTLVTQHSLQEDAKHAISILLVEDNPVNQKLAVTLLAKAGYRVTVAQNGREAVDMMTAVPAPYDIVFMDIQMPLLNGLDATRLLREQGHRDLPIVAMTAQAMKGDREKCLAAGMNDYIGKPIKREAVFEMLRKWVIERPAAGLRLP